jgi:hypothetical protein
VTAAGQRIRVFSIIDSFTQQNRALHSSTGFPNRRAPALCEIRLSRFADCGAGFVQADPDHGNS